MYGVFTDSFCDAHDPILQKLFRSEANALAYAESLKSNPNFYILPEQPGGYEIVDPPFVKFIDVED